MKKTLSLLLAMLMIFSLLPVSALADDAVIEEKPIAAEEILTEEPEEELAEEPEEEPAEEPVPAEEPEAAAEEVPAEPAEESTEALPAEEEAAEELEALGETKLLAAPGPSTNIIDAKYIPDKNFRQYLTGEYSTLTLADAAEVTSLALADKEISNLTGIQYFTGLRDLFVYDNALTKLDMSGCTNLSYLNCKSNKLTELNLSGCSNLEYLYCHNNCLTELNLSGCTNLLSLYCDNNCLTELDLSTCPNLLSLYCESNCLTMLDLSGRSSFETLYCGNNALTKLYLTGCANLEDLYCDNNCLTELDLSTCTDLARFDCDKNELAELDLSTCPNLLSLYCESNCLTKLNLRGCPNLEYLDCENNRLLGLDLSSNKNLSAFFSYLGTQYPREPVGATVLNRVYVPDDIVVAIAVLDEPSGGRLEPDREEEHWEQLLPGSIIFIAEETSDVLNYAIEVELFSGETATMLISRPVECAAADFAVGPDYILMELGQEPEKITCNYSEPVKRLIDLGLLNITYTACDANDPDVCTVIALDSGKVVPLTAGTAYVDVALELTRVPLRIHRVCVDVVAKLDKTEVVAATLPVTTATVELFKTDYTEIDVLLDLQRWYDDELKDSALLGIVEPDSDAMSDDKGTAIDYAEFAEKILNDMFILVPVSDRRLAVVPNPDYIRDVYNGVCTAPKKVSAPIVITLNSGDTLETEALTVTLKTTQPKLKATALKFNSLLNEEKTIVFSGGKVKEIAAAAKPAWLQLDKNAGGCTLKYTGKSGIKHSGKVTLECALEGWAVTAPVTVSVSASAVKPKITWNKKSVTLTAGTSDDICCTATISPGAFAKDWHLVSVIDTKTKQTLTVNGSTVPSVYTYNYASSNGTAVSETRFHAPIYSPDGKTHSYKYTFAAGGATAAVTVKVLPETTPIKLTAKTTGTIDFSVPGSTVTFTPTLTNMKKMPDVGYNAHLRITDVKGEKKGADPISAWDYFCVSMDEYDYNADAFYAVPLRVTADKDSIPAGYTYYAYVDAVNSNGDVLSSVKVKIPVKTSNPAKVKPSVTAKVSGKPDPLRTNGVILTVTAKNFNGWDNEDVTLGFYRTYDGANNKAEMQHLGNSEEPKNPFWYDPLEGGVQIFISDPFAIHPKDKFAVQVSITNDYDVTAVSGLIKLPVTVGKAALKLDNANATMLQGDPYSEATFVVTYADTSLRGIGTVQLDPAYANLFELTLQKNGAYVLHWKDSMCPPAMKRGTVKTVKLKVWMEGSAAVDEDGNLINPTVKPNATLQLKVTVR